MSESTRDDLLALTPERYLEAGYTADGTTPRPELRADWAAASVSQLMAAECSAQELAFTVDAVKLLLPEHDEPEPDERLAATVDEALETVARGIQQPNNEGLLQWLSQCVAAVQTEADLSAFLEHAEAVRKQYAVLVALLSASPS